ncbi:MAG: protein of unknown function with transrane region [Parcubacteria group bacterium]|nr:protein of unknown function with transrane region [Parcubacteria group bacterium]
MNPDDVKPKTDSPYTPPNDPSAYIRTYAKDVAQLTNSPAPISAAAPAKSQASDNDGVALPDYDASPVNNRDNPSSPKEFKSEVVALSSDDSEGIFSTTRPPTTPQSVSMMPQGSIGVMPTVAPSGSASAAPDETVEQKEAVLARLRAKLASHTPTPTPVAEMVMPVMTAPPESVAPFEPQKIEPPVFVRPPEPPIVPLPVRESVAPIAPAPTEPAASASPIHTFSSDFSDRIDSQRASTFSVLASQSDSKPLVLASKKRSRLVPIIAGAVLLLCGIGIVTGAIIYTRNTSTVPVVAGVPSLLTFDESVEVKGTGATLMQAVADVAGQASVAGNVVVTYITAPGAAGGSVPQPGGALIEALALNAPTILTRNIDESSTVGTIHAGSESRPFLVLRVNSFERTFAGMLAWEPDMAAGLATFFPAYTDVSTAIVATTSSSSSALPSSIGIASPFFNDAVVANHDVRILRDAKGRSLMLYGYHGKDTLVIARDEAAFTALIARLTATATQ